MDFQLLKFERFSQKIACNKDTPTPLNILPFKTAVMLHYILLTYCTNINMQQYLIIPGCDLQQIIAFLQTLWFLISYFYKIVPYTTISSANCC